MLCWKSFHNIFWESILHYLSPPTPHNVSIEGMFLLFIYTRIIGSYARFHYSYIDDHNCALFFLKIYIPTVKLLSNLLFKEKMSAEENLNQNKFQPKKLTTEEQNFDPK